MKEQNKKIKEKWGNWGKGEYKSFLKNNFKDFFSISPHFSLSPCFL